MLPKIKNTLKLILPSLLIGFLIFNIYQNWNLVIGFWTDFKIIPLLISFSFMILIYLEAAFNYHILIKALGYPPQFSKSIYIFIVSNASRYIPGSIWQYIGRVEMAKRIGGLPRSVSVLELVLEVFLLINAATIVSLIGLPLFKGLEDQNYLFIFAVPISLIFLHPKIAAKLIEIIAKVGKKNISQPLTSLNFREIFFVLPWFILNFLLNGVALFFMTRAIYPEIGAENILLFSGIFAFSWAVGYLSIFAPAGLGVTDVLLVYLLSFQMPFALSSTIALSYRVLLTIAELVIFLFVMKLNPNEKDKQTDTKKAWEERSIKYGYKVEGVATKSLPPSVNRELDLWMYKNIESAIDKISSKKTVNVLDLGCGYGRLSKPLLKKFPSVKTYGVDISKTYVELYNKDLKPRGKAVEADIKKLPFKNNFFDVVFVVTTLMYLTKSDEQKKAIQEILRVLKPGGKAVIIERSPSGYALLTLGGLISLIRGKKNKEISATSIEKESLKKNVFDLKAKVEEISGIPFLSFYMLLSVLLSKLNPKLAEVFLEPIMSVDRKFKSFLWPSLYLCYRVSKPSSKR